MFDQGGDASAPTISHKQYQALMEYLECRNPASILPIQIAYYTGLHTGEVCGLTWQDIDLDGQCLTVRWSLKYSSTRHIFKGLTDAARQFMIHLMPLQLSIASDAPAGSYLQKEASPDLPERLHNASTQERAAAVQKVRELWEDGLNLTQISKRDYGTTA